VRRKILIFVCLLVIALMVASTVPVGAKKPIKPPPDGGSDPTGTIFYSHSDANDDYNIYSMNADGSSKALLVQATAGMDALSLKTHMGGHYWFVGFIPTTGSHPDGVIKTQLVAIRDDNTKSVVLLNDPTMSYNDWNGPPCWLSDDEHLSWTALKWTEDGDMIDIGIYKVEISFGTSDDDPELTSTPTVVWSAGTYYHSGGKYYTPDISYPNWSSDGEKIAMKSMDHDRTVVDFSIVPTKVTHISGYGLIFWSPDGTKLAYGISGDLHVMNPDGSDDTTLITHRSSKKISKDMKRVGWSPDSKFLMYTISSFKLMTWDESAKLYTIGVDGSGNTCVSSGISVSDSVWGRCWR